MSVCPSVRPSVCPCVRPSVRLSAWNNSASTGRIFIKFYIWICLETLSRKFKFHYNLTRIRSPLHEDLCTFMTICPKILLKMRSVSDKSCRESQNTYFCFITFFRISYRLWDNVEKRTRAWQATDDNIIRRMRFVWWINKTTNTPKICNTYYLSMATMVMRTRINIALHVNCLPSNIIFPSHGWDILQPHEKLIRSQG
jgi:hypothetical protein